MLTARRQFDQFASRRDRPTVEHVQIAARLLLKDIHALRQRAAIGFADIEKEREVFDHLASQANLEMRQHARELGRARRIGIRRRRQTRQRLRRCKLERGMRRRQHSGRDLFVSLFADRRAQYWRRSGCGLQDRCGLQDGRGLRLRGSDFRRGHRRARNLLRHGFFEPVEEGVVLADRPAGRGLHCVLVRSVRRVGDDRPHDLCALLHARGPLRVRVDGDGQAEYRSARQVDEAEGLQAESGRLRFHRSTITICRAACLATVQHAVNR